MELQGELANCWNVIQGLLLIWLWIDHIRGKVAPGGVHATKVAHWHSRTEPTFFPSTIRLRRNMVLRYAIKGRSQASNVIAAALFLFFSFCLLGRYWPIPGSFQGNCPLRHSKYPLTGYHRGPNKKMSHLRPNYLKHSHGMKPKANQKLSQNKPLPEKSWNSIAPHHLNEQEPTANGQSFAKPKRMALGWQRRTESPELNLLLIILKMSLHLISTSELLLCYCMFSHIALNFLFLPRLTDASATFSCVS